jgi:uncharacterized ferritin-like protein (DUF455 family)
MSAAPAFAPRAWQAPHVNEPEHGTVERWAYDYVRSTSLAHKLTPPPRPDRWEASPRIIRLDAPGRPPELRPIARPPKTPRKGALRDPRKRAQLVHTFFHHELQAAELMAWAVLAFADAPHDIRRGFVRITDDEIRHARLYAAHLERLGSRVGAFGVRDWFWTRVAQARDPAQFVALLGIGFEGGNLDHAARFAAAFREAGDDEGARIQELVATEEIAHVRFAVRSFETLTGGPLTFDRWLAMLPPPLTPIVMRGRPIQREARVRAGLPPELVDALASYEPP